MTTADFMDRLGQRWDRRQQTYRDGREPFTAQSSIHIAAEPQAVWDFLNAPGVGVLLDHRHLKTFPVPGTPEIGAGHQYCSMSQSVDGRLVVMVSEVVEFEAPHRLVERVLSATVPMVEATTITATERGCQYAMSVGLRILIGSAKTAGRHIQKQLDERAAKVKAIVESGVWPGKPGVANDVFGGEEADSED